MKISFDLDDTLIPGGENNFPTEKRNIFQKFLNFEKIRKGTKNVFGILKKDGHKVGVYTTSYRLRFKIMLQFLSYGIKLDFIINEYLNKAELNKRNVNSSKYPPAFDIDYHIDDSRGVEKEGNILNFKTIIIDSETKNWSDTILQNINKTL